MPAITENGKREEAILSRLVDPSSAKFGEHVTKGGLACVETNSRNRMGGYTGKTWTIMYKYQGEWHIVDQDDDCPRIIGEMLKDDKWKNLSSR